MDRLESIKFEIQNTASDYIDDTFSFLNECIPMAKNASDPLKDYTPLLSTSTATYVIEVQLCIKISIFNDRDRILDVLGMPP